MSKNPNVVFLAMNVGDDNERMAEWWDDKGYGFPTLNDADDLAQQYGIKAFPSSIIIGPDGKVLKAKVGSLHELESELGKNRSVKKSQSKKRRSRLKWIKVKNN
eukprot:TRINITY_DN79762_c0_g1_i2.p4 TRINITY_DN79762_c0_g1~~TRINITY_DN79762_c0_g1_i2.p4  ORF type:complete len:104 (-),score=20.83 TRINITY_DN79762_c0_g1_i2:1-312(-)